MPTEVFDTAVFSLDPNLRSLAAGERLFSYGDEGNEMYIVVEGEIELDSPDQGVLEIVRPGEMFGEMALVEHSPRVASATAASSAKIVPISPTRFAYLAQNTPYFALEVVREMARRLQRMDERR